MTLIVRMNTTEKSNMQGKFEIVINWEHWEFLSGDSEYFQLKFRSFEVEKGRVNCVFI